MSSRPVPPGAFDGNAEHPAEWDVPLNSMIVAAADRTARYWTFGKPGRIRIGSHDHMIMFARMLLETHNPYKPRVLDWPKLDPEAHARLTGLPIWDIAVQTEGRASLRVLDYAATLSLIHI